MKPKPFKFKLQSVLDLKIQIEDEEKEKLAKLNAEKAREEMILRGLQEAKVETTRVFKDKQRGELDIVELKQYEAHLKKLEYMIVNQRLRIKELEIKIEEQRQVVIEASKERKTFEKLKDKHKEAFIKEMEMEERKFIDELAITRYRRGEKERGK
ncbi:MAG: flagellar export protein FliJ [Candidatus Eremiobacteraeota bacterium]|nr:flagellar export protein FliJ [Candidatus Eremiobacteraeota bacterium]